MPEAAARAQGGVEDEERQRGRGVVAVRRQQKMWAPSSWARGRLHVGGTHGVGGPTDFDYTFALAPPLPPSPCKSEPGIFSFSLRQPHPHLPRVEERVGGGCFASTSQHKAVAAAVPTSLPPLCSRRRAGRVVAITRSRHPRFVASARLHLPRIEERVGGGSSASAVAISATAAVTAAPTLLLRVWVACWGLHARLLPAPSSFVRASWRRGWHRRTLLPAAHAIPCRSATLSHFASLG
ncbi:LOW QUALITY PROTEIN: hypothetical protein CVT26_004862 [Gymnopilus dilepis]|uniref:Uncharacterized protein n=1 Tax=Gymnopilus dilepis TaxID=231916 RepID=A0A409YTR9_9AGAR|nr:LOW QUALITY PROTEIN: hypothetical protein CVT26_004862 [Gymnopilus dilepis]